MAHRMKFIFWLLSFVTVGLMIGSVSQLALLRQLEDSNGTGTKSRIFRRLHQRDGFLQLPRGISFWKNDNEAEILRLGYIKPEALSWSPRIILLHNFLSMEECEFLKAIALPHLQNSKVVDADTGKGGSGECNCSGNIVKGLSVKPTKGNAVLFWSMGLDGKLDPNSLHGACGVLSGNKWSAECEFLKAIALPHLQKSKVVDADTGKSINSNVRTSSGMFLSFGDRKYPMAQAIEKRISIYAQVPIENGEPIQILRYQKNQYYKPHHDYFSDTYNLKNGGQRIATMLMYLSDNVEGGETYFPTGGSGECNCSGNIVKGLSVKPTKGNAVLFWSMGLDGKLDPNSLHGACGVLSGNKWSAVKWMRERAYS